MLKLFKVLPIACIIGGNTLVLHGGLFADSTDPSQCGTLDQLKRAARKQEDFIVGCISDVLWSDPCLRNGIRPNDFRGV